MTGLSILMRICFISSDSYSSKFLAFLCSSLEKVSFQEFMYVLSEVFTLSVLSERAPI